LEKKGFVNEYGLSRKNIFDSVKRSLEHLQPNHIDVLQCHHFDPDTLIKETMQALHEFVKGGIRPIHGHGMGSCHASVLSPQPGNHRLCYCKQCHAFYSMQNHHSLVYREHEMFPTLNHFGVGVIPWSPLARGLLTRSLKTDT
ncbi:NADP-dependent oxidoreductase domain-containing protein, partial [Lactarius quietus]